MNLKTLPLQLYAYLIVWSCLITKQKLQQQVLYNLQPLATVLLHCLYTVRSSRPGTFDLLPQLLFFNSGKSIGMFSAVNCISGNGYFPLLTDILHGRSRLVKYIDHQQVFLHNNTKVLLLVSIVRARKHCLFYLLPELLLSNPGKSVWMFHM